MNGQLEGAGWYTDPAGTYEMRYFDGQWTDQVATHGVVGTQPLPVAAPGPRPSDGPVVPVVPAGPRRRTKLWALVAAGAAAATVVVVLAVRPGDSGSSFCSDYVALGDATASAKLNDGGMADVRKITGMFRRLAAEAPAAAKADLNLLAKDMSTLADTGNPLISDSDAQAAADRLDDIAASQCGG